MLGTFRSIEIANCVFDKNCGRYWIIVIYATASLTFMNDVNFYGELIDLLLYHVYVHDTIFKNNFSGFSTSYTSQLQRILFKNLLINESSSASYLISIVNTKKVIDANANLVKATFKKGDVIFKDSIFTHSYSNVVLFCMSSIYNSYIKNVTLESNINFENNDVNTLLWRYYVSDSNLYTKILLTKPIVVQGGLLWWLAFCYNVEVSECKFINNNIMQFQLLAYPSAYYLRCENVNITGLTFEGNKARNTFSGICLGSDYCKNFRVTNSTFKNSTNTSSGTGSGALYFQFHENAYLENIIISNTTSPLICSGIYFSGISLYLNNVTIESNLEIAQYGTVCYTFTTYFDSNTHIFEVKNSIFKENINFNSKGGAIYINGNTDYSYKIGFYAKDSLFIANRADSGSAIYIDNNVILTNDSFIDSCTFISNIADNRGIITILAKYENLNILNSLFTSNKADYGSIIFLKMSESSINSEESKFILTSCTFAENFGQIALGIYGIDQLIYIETVKCIFKNNEGIAINLAYSHWKDTESIIT